MTRLGAPNSQVKQKIFGLNSAQLYNLDLNLAQRPAFTADKLAAIKAKYLALGSSRDNNYTGYIAKKNKVA